MPDSERLQFIRLHGSTEEQFHQLSRHRIDVVVHCATRYSAHASLVNADEMISGNIQAGLPLVEYASENKSLFINLSTVFQHGPGLRYHPNSLYAATKQAFADVLEHYILNRDLLALDLCLHDTYGPGDRRRKLMPQLLEALLSQQQVNIGSLDTPLNLLYISDVVQAIITSIETGVTGSFSVVADANHTIREIIDVLEQISGLQVPFAIDPDLLRNSVFPRAVAPRLPLWKPAVELHQGLSNLLKDCQA